MNNRDRRIIALYSPWPQCGKTTAAKYLEQFHSFERWAFAAPLKGMLQQLLKKSVGLEDADDRIFGEKKEEPIAELGGITARRLMQTLGTEWGRALDKDFWVKVLAAQLEKTRAMRIVIDDMRFPNEYDMLKARGAIMVRIERGDVFEAAERHVNHPSEGALDGHKFDCTLYNGGTIQQLYKMLDAAVLPASQYY